MNYSTMPKISKKRLLLKWYFKEFGHPEYYIKYPKRWVDHYKIDDEGNFVSEPYAVMEDDIKDLARIADMGFDVSITARSEYYPNHTVKIIITPIAQKLEQLPITC